jgi:hypothetical protein
MLSAGTAPISLRQPPWIWMWSPGYLTGYSHATPGV